MSGSTASAGTPAAATRVALVTGAGRLRGIGRAIALELARSGFDVVVTGTGRDPKTFPPREQAVGWRDIGSVADEIRALGRRALALALDLSDPAAVEALMARTVRDLGRLDVLVNNASAARGADRVPVVQMEPAVWRRVIETNLHGTFYASQAFARQLIAAGHGGAIVNVSSVAARLKAPATGAYAASKAAIEALTVVLASELGQHGIRVNTVAPGLIDTSRTDDMPRGGMWEGVVRTFIPMGRSGTPEDVARLVAFLCSDGAEWLSGQCIGIDGGHANTLLRNPWAEPGRGG